MADWRKELQPASFRGVPFEVLNESSPFGRRVQVHEFVQRDTPYAEDLGRVTRTFSVTGFVGGDACFVRRDALLAVLDEPGLGELILPAWGALQVTALPGNVSHARDEGGLVRFDLQFVESGEKGYPIATPATDAQMGMSADDVLDAGSNWFSDAMAQVDAARVNIAAMTGSVAAAYGQVTSTIGSITSTVANAAALVDMVLNAPGNLLSAVRSGVDSVRGSLQSVDPSAALANLRSAASGCRRMGSVNPAGGAHTVAAVQAVQELVRHAQLAVALEAGAQVPAQRQAVPADVATPVWQQAVQPVERPQVLYQADVLAGRDVLDAALWDALQGGGGRPPVAVFNALQQARTTARRHMAQAASASVPLVVVTPGAVMPTLVLAYRQWGDATRAPEIAQRNRIAHPGFVPPKQLQVARE